MKQKNETNPSEPVSSSEKENNTPNQEKNKSAEKTENEKPPNTEDDSKDESFGDTGDFVLKPNFSTEPEDQWDIVKYLESHAKWPDFSQVLTHEMEVQMSVETQVPMALPGQGLGEDGFQTNIASNEFSVGGVEENPQEDGDNDGDNDGYGEADGDSSDSDNEEE